MEAEMQSYQKQLEALRDLLNKARSALARDIAAAVSTKDWHKFLRDRHDVEALVGHIDALAGHAEFVKKLQAAGDHMRQQVRQRGRPRKPASKAAGPATRPAGAASEAS
jgi:hypothetical protein